MLTTLVMRGNALTIPLPDNTVHAVVTDPPYGLRNYSQQMISEMLTAWLAGDHYEATGGGFMGRKWDAVVPGPAYWREVLRVARPGAHALVFAGSRTLDLMTIALRLAGWEVRDAVMWVYGSGFPKNHDVSKAIDAEAGAEREVIGAHKKLDSFGPNNIYGSGPDHCGIQHITAPATPAAQQWDGWGTALKPAFEPVILARKPLEGTVAQNVLKWGCGGLNIDGCRVAVDDGDTNGRWPANLLHDGSPEATAGFPDTSGGSASGYNWGESNNDNSTHITHNIKSGVHFGDSGSAARYFYCAKASAADRDEGLDGFEVKQAFGGGGTNNTPDDVCGKYGSVKAPSRNPHPTVKPTAMLRYLIRLITPPGAVLLDPFCGSGSTGKAATMEDVGTFIGLDLEAGYPRISLARIRHAVLYPTGYSPALDPAPDRDLSGLPLFAL